MKKITLVLVALFVMVILRAQQALTKSQSAVQETVIKAFAALSNRDSVSLKRYCTNDIALYEYGMVWNLDTLITKAIVLNTAADFKRINTFDFINTTVNKNTAWATYNLQSEIVSNGKQRRLQWMETVVLVRERKLWKIQLLHSSLIKRD